MSAKKGEQWTEAETRALIAAWGDRQIQDKIDKSHRNADVYTEIAKAVAKPGFPWTRLEEVPHKDKTS